MKCYSAHVSGSLSAGMNRPLNTIARGGGGKFVAEGWHRVLIVGLLLAVIMLVAPVAADSWTPADFTSHYRAYIHGAATDLTDYQIKFVLYNMTGTDSSENLHLPGIAQPTYNDVRFALGDGTLLTYWMETPTGIDNATFWVKVPSVPAGYANTVPVDVYYGNPTIGSAADGDATFALFDDFEGSSLDTTKWTLVSGTGASISNSQLILAGENKIQSLLLFKQNASVRFRGNLYRYTQYVGFQNNADSTNFIYLRVANDEVETLYTRIKSVVSYVNCATWPTDNYQTGELLWNSTHVAVTDGANPLTAKTAVMTTSLPAFLRSGGTSSKGYYDWVFVRQLADSEPTVNEPAGTAPTVDLAVNSVSSPTPRIANTITATLVNLGTGDAGAFKANLTLNGTTTTVDIAGLAAANSTTVSVTDPVTTRVLGDTVPLTIELDTTNAIAETNETNNTYSVPLTVVRGGTLAPGYYMGGRYYTGHDLETRNYTEGHVALLHSWGDSGYKSNGEWASRTVQWTAADLPVPADATVKAARLYQSYTWSTTGDPGLTAQFNGNTVEQAAFYGDGLANIYSTYDDFNGQVIYDVTPYFSKDGNTALITAAAPKGGLYATVLVVIYEDNSQLYRKIWLDEGCDSLLYGGGTGFAMFNNVTTNSLGYARLSTVLPSGADNAQGTVVINSQNVALTNADGTNEGQDPGFKYYDVTGALQDGTNELAVTNDGYMNLAAAILELTYEAPPSGVSFSANLTSGENTLTVQFTDLSYGATSWQWDFNNDGTIESTEKNPVYTYTNAGTYTVNLTATNAYGSTSMVKTGYITVTGGSGGNTGPVVSFSADITSGTFPLTVQFTDGSTGNVTAWAWDFTNDGVVDSTVQNPAYNYTNAGTYSVNLTATNAEGTNSTVKSGYITVSIVSAASLPLTTEQTGTVSGDLYVGSFQPVPFGNQPTSGVTSRDFDQSFTLPNFTNIQWAKVYMNIYSMSGSRDIPSRTTTSLDGNGDGTYETVLGVEEMTSGSSYSTDGKVYWINDHTNRVYSDYETSYDVTNLITSSHPAVHVKNEKTGTEYDGRLKAVTLVVAYNDGDSDTVKYWVNHGHDWFNAGSSSTTFGTAGIPTGFTDATLNNVALSSTDGTYTFNSVSQAGANPVAPINYYENHTWSVTGAVNPVSDSVFQYALGSGSSFKTTLAALAVKYPGATTVAPVASFTANVTSGTAPLTVGFTDTSSNSPTSWAWDFTNDGVIDATTQNATYTYASAGTYTVNLTVANTAGSNTSVQVGYVTVTSAAGTGGLADSAWPKFQGDANNTGQSLYNGPGTNNSIWSYTTSSKGYVYSAPAIGADGTVYIGSADRKLYALRANGTLNWSYTTGNIISGAPAVASDGTIYIGGRDSKLYALRADGTLKWSYTFGSQVWGSPVIGDNGIIYIGSRDKNLYALNPDGSLKWSYTTAGEIRGSPAMKADGTIYVGSSDKNLYAVNSDGTLKWTYTTGNSIEGSPAIRADGTVCIGSSDAKVYAINPDGTLRWSYTTGNGITGSPAVGANGILYIGGKDARVYALNPDGSLIWTATTGSAIAGSPAIGADSVLYIGSNDCKVYAFKDVTPVANFTSTVISGTEGYIPLTVQFTDSSSNIPTTWFWDFGDGTTSTEQNPSHTFTLPGTYSVNLTVKNAAGSGSITKTDYIKVATPSSATAEFAADTTTGLAPLTVYFTGEPVGIVTTWAWDFDNNGIIDATTQNASYQYPSPGTYTVNLTVTNAVGSKTILKTDYIVVTGALPAADFTADPTNGKAALTVHFYDISTGSISGWAWDFNNDGLTDASTQNPTHTYVKAGNYSVNLTVSGPMGSNSTVKKDLISVISNIDLTVSTINPLIFSHYMQSPISATIRNSGTENATAFNVTFSIDGKNTTILVSGLGAGASNSFSITDTEDRTSGASVPITVTLDPDNLIGEINETNNGLTTSTAVIANGYTGHRWSDGSDLTTKRTYLLHGDTIISLGDSQYGKNGAIWTAGNLPIPEGAIIKDAHVYHAYCWDPGHVMGTETELVFNGINVPVEHEYWEWKGWGDYSDYAYGVHVANVTDLFNTSGNSEYGTVETHSRGSALVVTYEDPSATEKQVFVNEGFDMLFAAPNRYYTTPETATAYAPFTGAGINIGKVKSATVITSITRGSGRGTMLFNGMSWPTYWAPGAGEVGLNSTDITPYLTAENNTVLIRSNEEGWGIEAYLGILKVEYQKESAVPVTSFTANVTSGTAPLTIAFTDASTGSPTAWNWSFGDGAQSNATNPVHTYTSAGNYSVSLTVTNSNGTNSTTRSNYITVTSLQSTATLSATSASGIGRNQNGTIGIYLNNSFSPKAGSLTAKLYYNESILTAQSMEIMGDGVAPINLSSPITIAIATASGIPNGNAWLANVTFRSGQDTEVTSALGLALITLTDTSIPPQDLRGMTRIQNGTFTTGGGIQIQVVGADGNPVIADRIALEGGAVPFSVTNTSSHRFSAVPAGTYQLTVTKAGHISVNTTIHYAAGSVRELTATLVTHAYQPTVILAENGVSLAGMTHTAPEQLNALRNETDQYNLTLNGGGVVSVALEYPMRFQLNQPQVTSAVPVGTEMRNGTFLWTNPSYTTTNATLVVTAVPASGQSPLGLLLTGGKLGDVYYNGQITSTDSLYILHYIVGDLKSLPTYDYADITRDGKITSTDALYILHYIVGNVNEYYQKV